jgi:hypothetical protein
MARRTRSNTPIAPVGDSVAENQDGSERSNDGGGVDAASGPGSDGTVIEPGAIAGGSDNGDQSRQRKHRSDRGAKRGPRGEKADKIDLGDFAQILSEVHSGVALMTNIPELALDETSEEHIKLARAMQRVIRHYDLPSVDAKTLDHFLLAKTLCVIYGTRLIAYNMRRRAERARAVNPPPALGAKQSPTATQASPPPPMPVNPASPTVPTKAPFAPPPTHIRSAPIPGFEHITVDVPVSKPN